MDELYRNLTLPKYDTGYTIAGIVFVITRRPQYLIVITLNYLSWRRYEDQLFHFNTVERVLSYRHDIIAPGLDHCYDCRAEVQILTDYLSTMTNPDNQQIPTKLAVTKLVETINSELLAHKRLILLEFNSNYYNVRFTDMQLGFSAEQIFTEENRFVVIHLYS